MCIRDRVSAKNSVEFTPDDVRPRNKNKKAAKSKKKKSTKKNIKKTKKTGKDEL